MLTSRDVYRGGLVRTISQSYRVARSNLDVQLGNLSRCFSPESGNADTPVYPFRGALSFTTIFFMSALAFQRLVVARVFLRDRQNSETLAGIFAARNIRRYFFLSLSCDSVANSRNSVDAIHSRRLFGKSLKIDTFA